MVKVHLKPISHRPPQAAAPHPSPQPVLSFWGAPSHLLLLCVGFLCGGYLLSPTDVRTHLGVRPAAPPPSPSSPVLPTIVTLPNATLTPPPPRPPPAAASPGGPLCAGDTPASAREVAWNFTAPTDAKTLQTLEVPLRLSVGGCGEVDGAFVRACYHGRHILFIGDSLTRYQYLNLVQFLTYDSWTPFHGKGVPMTEVERVVGNSKLHWGSWPNFMAGTNERLQGHEICDCFRDTSKHPFVLENRYFYHPGKNVRVSFVFLGPLDNYHHHDLGFLNATCGARGGCAQAGCTPMANTCDEPATKASYYAPADGAEAQAASLHRVVVGSARELASRVAPIDALVVNLGYNGGAGWPRKVNWDPPVHREVYKSALLNVTRLLVNESLAAHLVWKSTTASGGNDYVPDVEVKWVNDTLVPLGWSLFDAFHLTRALGGNLPISTVDDGIHYKPHAYRGLNEALALQLCGSIGAPFWGPNSSLNATG